MLEKTFYAVSVFQTKYVQYQNEKMQKLFPQV